MKPVEEMKVLLSTQCGANGIMPDYHITVCTMVATAKCQLGMTLIKSQPVPFAQNNHARIARDDGFDYLLLMDADTTNCPSDIIERFIAWDKDVVSAYSYNRHFPYMANVFKLQNETESLYDLKPERHSGPNGGALTVGQGLQKVDMVSTQMLLIKTEVFSKVEFPWFSYEKNILPDAFFCQKCRDAGVEVWCDTDYVAEHGGLNPIKRKHLIAYHEEVDGKDYSQYDEQRDKKVNVFKSRHGNKIEGMTARKVGVT